MKNSHKIKKMLAVSAVAVALLAATPAVAGPVTGLGIVPLAQGLCLSILTPVGWAACAAGWTAVGIGWLPFWP